MQTPSSPSWGWPPQGHQAGRTPWLQFFAPLRLHIYEWEAEIRIRLLVARQQAIWHQMCIRVIYEEPWGELTLALFSLSSGVSSPVFTISYLMALGMMVSIRSITGRLVLIDLSWNHTLHRRFKWRRKKNVGMFDIEFIDSEWDSPWSC